MIDPKAIIELSKDLRVLYAEDEVDVQQELKNMFSIFFKEIIVANNGQEGIELYKERKNEIDLVISDIRMPKKDGLEMVKEIRDIDSEVPVVMLTAFSEHEYFINSINLKVDKYLLKPIDKEMFLSTVYDISKKISDKKMLEQLLQEKQEAQLRQKEQETMQKITEAYSFPMAIFDSEKLLHSSNAFIKLFGEDKTASIKELSLDTEGLFDDEKGFMRSFSDYDDKNYEFNKVHITQKVGKKIFRVYKKEIEYAGKNAQMYIFVDITFEEYLRVKSRSYMESLERLVVKSKVSKTKSVKEKEPQAKVLEEKPKETDKTQTMLRKNHKSEELSATDFIAKINPIYVSDLQELDDLDQDLLDAIMSFEDGSMEALAQVSSLFATYAENIYFLEDFTDLYTVINNLAKLLDELDFSTLAEEKHSTFMLYLQSIREDLAYWRKSIFIDQNAPNIHYLDSSLFSSCLQLEALLSSDESEAEDDLSDLEFF